MSYKLVFSYERPPEVHCDNYELSRRREEKIVFLNVNITTHRTALHASASTDDDSRRPSVPQHPEDLEQHPTLPTGVHPRQRLVHRSRSHSPGKPTAPNNHRPSFKKVHDPGTDLTQMYWLR